VRGFAEAETEGEGTAGVVAPRLCDNIGVVACDIQGSCRATGGRATPKEGARRNWLLMQEKEEQNIKRRVYDALNVLISLGALVKEGRKITVSTSRKLRQSPSSNHTQIKQLKQQAALLATILQEKRDKLQLTEEKKCLI